MSAKNFGCPVEAEFRFFIFDLRFAIGQTHGNRQLATIKNQSQIKIQNFYMYSKLLALIILSTAMGAILLTLRQRQIESTYEISTLHHQIEQTRDRLWDLQVEIAGHISPQKMQEAIRRAQLELEPIEPQLRRPMPDSVLTRIPREAARDMPSTRSTSNHEPTRIETKVQEPRGRPGVLARAY